MSNGDSEQHPREAELGIGDLLDPADALPLLHRLARTAEEGSTESLFAFRHLAALLVERDPWRAALYARRVLARVDDDRAWSALALAMTLLGHYRFAVSAYRRALLVAPRNPWYSHNLGHLLDVALNRHEEAIPLLESAFEQVGPGTEVALSLAHALGRVGDLAGARRVVLRAMEHGPSREQSNFLRWLDRGAPPHAAPLPRPRPSMRSPSPGRRADVSSKQTLLRIEEALVRGLSKLPLNVRQRARARMLARDVVRRFPASELAATSIVAAAIAYAILYVDLLPLSQAEVAASFRVSVSSLRARFGELRTELALTPGDDRYASNRRR